MGHELWPFIMTVLVSDAMKSWQRTYNGRDQSKDIRFKVVRRGDNVALYVSDGISLFHFACYISKLHTKGGVILTNPEDIFNFIAS